MLFQYANESAWFTFIIITPGLLLTYIAHCWKNVELEDDGPRRCGNPSLSLAFPQCLKILSGGRPNGTA